LNIKSEIKQVM